jgi:hypothetical protein
MNPIAGINNICDLFHQKESSDYIKLCEEKKNIVSKFPDCTIINDTLIFTQFKDYFVTNLLEFKTSSTRKYIISFIVMMTKYDYFHANILIYDTEQNRVERFEPNGLNQSIYNGNSIDDILFEKFKLLNIQYTKVSYFLPKIGPQPYDTKLLVKDTGFCATWCILYVFLRVAFPDISLNELIGDMTKWNKNDKKRNILMVTNFFLGMI